MAKLKDLKVTIGLSKKGLSKLNADLRRTKSNFKRNFGEIADIAKAAGRAIITGIGVGLTAIVKSGADLQKLRVGFRSIMGSAEGAAEMVGKLNKFTATTPFRLEEVSRSARQLIAVGTGVDDVNDRLRMLGDIAAASGNSISDIAAIFAKVQAKGKVDLESLNQMAERGIPIFDTLREVTGDANMEFGAGSVSVEEYNAALAKMAEEGGFANGAMENLSETVSGKFSTALDNITLALGKFAESSGLLSVITNTLDDFTKAINRASLGEADLQQAREQAFDLRQKYKTAHKGNAAALREEMKAAADLALVLKQELGDKAEGHLAGTAAMLDQLDEAMAFGTLPDAPAATPTTAPAQTKKEFAEQFKAASALITAREQLAAATGAVTFSEDEYAEALQDVRAAMGDVTDGHIEMVAMEEESPIFDEDEQQRIEDGTKGLRRLAQASQMTGQVFNFMGSMVSAAFDNIKDKSQSFHEVMKQMLESLLKRAIALAATFAALMVFTGGSSKALAATGFKSFGGFMMGGMGIPQMAEGGMFTGASLAMVGEGAGTSAINPEVVAPLNKLRDMMGGSNVTVTGRLDGRDILISNERANFDRNRVRGF